MRSLAFIFLDDVLVKELARSAAVIVWRVGRYDSGKEDIIKVLNRVSDSVEPIFIRLSRRCSINWKCCLSSERWVFESWLSTSFMLINCSSASNRNSVLFVVTSATTTFHISLEVFSSFILLPRHVEVINRIIC